MNRAIVLCALLVLAANVSIASGQDDPVLDAPGFQKNRDYSSAVPYEHVDPLSGSIILTFTDLVLPGNAGRELRFQRTYNSNGQSTRSNWTFGINGLVMSISDPGYPANGSPISPDPLTWMWVWSPTLETADGRRIRTILQWPPGDTANTAAMRWVVSPQFWRYDRVERTLYLPDGTVCQYDTAGRLLAFSDPFGNTVGLTWGAGALTVVQTLGNSQERTVTLAMDDATGLPTEMTYNGLNWRYTCDPLGYSTCRFLTSVTPPLGPAWSYAYGTVPEFPLSPFLTTVTTPLGGETRYDWIHHEWRDPPVGEPEIRRVSRVFLDQRHVGGRDVTPGTWRYTYSSRLYLPYTTDVVQPDLSVVTYQYSDVADSGTLDGGIALTGRSIFSSSGVALESEEREYISLTAVDHSARTYRTLEPRVVTIRRFGRAYQTTFEYSSTNCAGYHFPERIVEVGERSRVTNRTYTHLAPSCTHPVPSRPNIILGLLAEDRVTVDGEAFVNAWTYNTETGFRESESIYGVTTNFTADALGNIASATRNGSSSTTFEYSWGRVSSTHTPEYSVVREINPDGTVAWQQQAGRITRFTYDNLFRLEKTEPPGGTNPTITTYHEGGARPTTSRGTSVVTTTLDGFGRPIETVNAVGVRRTMRYDSEGRRTYESFPFVGPRGGPTDIGVTMTYDGLGRVLREDNPDGTYRERTYGPGWTNVRDEKARSIVQSWQAFGNPDVAQLVELRDAAAGVWTYTYSGLGRLAAVRTPDDVERRWYYYPGTELLQTETHPESGTVTYAYDSAGRLIQKTDAKGVIFTFIYDGNDRLIQESAGGRTTFVTYEAGSDNRRLVRNQTVSAELEYDPAGRLAERRETIDGRIFKTRFEYDFNDNLRAIEYPRLNATTVRRRVEYEHDAEGRIRRVFEGTTNYASEFEYHPSGAVVRYRAGNGLETTMTYDTARYWPRSVSVGSLNLQYYAYDEVGNVEGIADSRPGMSQTFGYDLLDRLVSAASDGAYPALTYAYDAHGNRTPAGGTSYTYEPGTLRLASRDGVTFQYDNNGNLRAAVNGTLTYTYTPHNLLESATVVGGTTTYDYDADDWRVRKSASGAKTYYLRGPGQQVLTEWLNPGPSGQTRDYIYAGTRLIAAVKRPTSEDAGDLYADIVPGGPSVSLTFTTPGQRAWLYFDGLAGQRVSAYGLATNRVPSNADLFSPLTVVRLSTGTNLGNDFGLGARAIFGSVELPATERYAVHVDPFSTGIGTVTTTLYDAPDVTGSITVNGPPVAVPLPIPGQRGRLTFEASAGQRISILGYQSNLQSTFPGDSLFYPVAIWRPDGSQLWSGNTGSARAFFDPIVIPAAGTYTLLVDPYTDSTGTATMSLYGVNDISDTMAIDGPAVTVPIVAPGQKARLALSATGQRVSIVGTQSEVVANGTPGATLWGPLAVLNGATVLREVSSSGTTAIVEPVQLGTGSYTVLVDAFQSTTGTASVRAYSVTDAVGSLAVNGGSTPVTLTTPGQQAELSFTVAGTTQPVTVRLTGNAIGNVVVKLLRADRTLVTSKASTSTTFTLPQQSLAPGDYIVVVDPYETNTGSINVAATNP